MPVRRSGSARLLRGRTMSQAQLDNIIKIVQGKGIKVVDWHVLGQPAPESIRGTLQVNASRAGALLQAIVKLKGLSPYVEVFPHGIPNPNLFNVRVRF